MLTLRLVDCWLYGVKQHFSRRKKIKERKKEKKNNYRENLTAAASKVTLAYI